MQKIDGGHCKAIIVDSAFPTACLGEMRQGCADMPCQQALLTIQNHCRCCSRQTCGRL